MRRVFWGLIIVLMGYKPLAASPNVVTTIAPVHSLVAGVMGDLGQPIFLLASGASPHVVALRPSQARSLTQADLIVWIGEDLERWLVRPLATLGDDAKSLELASLADTRLLPTRQLGHDASHTGHGHHAGVDPHAWLDPDNAKIWVNAIAAALSEIDSTNAAAYKANASQTIAAIDQAASDVDALIASLPDRRFVVFHDALQYFEHRFGVEAMGSLAGTAAERASAARMANLQEAIALDSVSCALYEPEHGPGSFEGLTADRTIKLSMVDPAGLALVPGPQLYPNLLRAIASSIENCN